MKTKHIEGGVCAAKGFKAYGVHCGIRKNQSKQDLALLFSEVNCAAAGVYTQNKVKGAPIGVTQAHIADGHAKAVICNSGIANTCSADGVEKAETMCNLTADALGIGPEDVIVASTGVIGFPIPIGNIKAGMPSLSASLSENGNGDFAQAIMTTDTVVKEAAVSFTIGGKACHIGGTAKGSGMIHPNMATMLCFLTTDVNITPTMLQKALSAVVEDTFNMVSIDGDTSTNDMVSILASGLAGNPVIDTEEEDWDDFSDALYEVMERLSKMIAADGEGATKLLECAVTGAPDKATAKSLAKSVITSSLVKTAMFGADANWGRILCALGYAQAEFDITKLNVSLCSQKGAVEVCKNGTGISFDEDIAKEILLEDAVVIAVELGQGEASATAWGCDLTYDYVKINGDYRT